MAVLRRADDVFFCEVSFTQTRNQTQMLSSRLWAHNNSCLQVSLASFQKDVRHEQVQAHHQPGMGSAITSQLYRTSHFVLALYAQKSRRVQRRYLLDTHAIL